MGEKPPFSQFPQILFISIHKYGREFLIYIEMRGFIGISLGVCMYFGIISSNMCWVNQLYIGDFSSG
jgi:hypothetical protein